MLFFVIYYFIKSSKDKKYTFFNYGTKIDLFFYIFTKQMVRMKKNYIYFLLLFFFSFSASVVAQDSRGSVNKNQDPTIEGLNVYPNPNNTGKVFITSKLNLDKKVEIFDVLGKKVIDVTLYSKELNITNLNPGVYIIKIKEGDASSTRKLIIN